MVRCGGGVLKGGVVGVDAGGVVPGVTVLAAEGLAPEVGVGMLLRPTADLAGGVTKPAEGVGVVGVGPERTYRCTIIDEVQSLPCWLLHCV